MDAYTRLRRSSRTPRSSPGWILAIQVLIAGWIGVGLGYLILQIIRNSQ